MPSSDQGATRDRYCLIPRTLIFLTCREEILLLKGAPNKRLWPGRYNGIGGHIEPGEDVLSAARRELMEETGLEPPSLWLCGTITIDTGQTPGIGLYIFRGECPQGAPQTSQEGTAEWLPIQKLADYALVEDLVTLLPKILSLQKGDPPISACYHYDPDDRLVILFGS